MYYSRFFTHVFIVGGHKEFKVFSVGSARFTPEIYFSTKDA